MQIKTTSHCKYDQIKLKSLTICISDENVEEPELCKQRCKEKNEGRKEGRRGGGEEGNGTTNLGKFGSFLNIHLLNDPGFILRCLVCGGVDITFFFFFPPYRRVSVSLFQLSISLQAVFRDGALSVSMQTLQQNCHQGLPFGHQIHSCISPAG